MTTSHTITLDVPIKRGETEITAITLHKPNAGSLRGVSISACMQLEVDAIINVVPRISDPKLTPQEAAALDLADITQAGVAIAAFFVPKAAMAEAETSLQSPTT